MLKIYGSQNVFDASLDRIRLIFDDFENVVIGFSGGKDSVVTLELALIVARERDRLPLSVMFLDQECEWQGTIDTVDEVMRRPEVKPYWLQIPVMMTNNASTQQEYTDAWHPDSAHKWMRPKSDISIHESPMGETRFHEAFPKWIASEFPDTKACYLAGMRTEESPKRLSSLTSGATYKWITWGSKLSKHHYTFYPIYDWSLRDVWKAIHSNGWKYNPVYDALYKFGTPPHRMRISSLNHETSVASILEIQEIEPDTWNRFTDRVDGSNSYKHLQGASFKCPKELPHMFESWLEYALYLAEHMMPDESFLDRFKQEISKGKDIFTDESIRTAWAKQLVATVLVADVDFTKLTNWKMLAPITTYTNCKRGRYRREMWRFTKYLTPEMIKALTVWTKQNEK